MERRAYPLEKLTSLRIGGPADRLVVPESESELGDALRRAADKGEPVRALGGGKNLLVSDRGVRGVVISFASLKEIEIRRNLVVAGAGAPIPSLVRRTVSAKLGGLECLAGIPGTVGGAVRMNAGGAHGSIGDYVLWVRGYTRSGEPFRFSRMSCGFGYRTSNLSGVFVTEVAFALEPGRPGATKKAREILADKSAVQPLSAATAGCMFRNPDLPSGESAGFLLEKAGVKGLGRGGARFSPLHANFVENLGGASCADVKVLIEEGRNRVFDRFGVSLSLEVMVWTREEESSLLPAWAMS